jgi:hypothetical protein
MVTVIRIHGTILMTGIIRIIGDILIMAIILTLTGTGIIRIGEVDMVTITGIGTTDITMEIITGREGVFLHRMEETQGPAPAELPRKRDK